MLFCVVCCLLFCVAIFRSAALFGACTCLFPDIFFPAAAGGGVGAAAAAGSNAAGVFGRQPALPCLALM